MDFDDLYDFIDSGDADDEVLDHDDVPDDSEDEEDILMSFEDSQQSSTSTSMELTFCDSDSDMLEEDVESPEQVVLACRGPLAGPAIPPGPTLRSGLSYSMRARTDREVVMSECKRSVAASDAQPRRDEAAAVVAGGGTALDKIQAVFDQIDCDLLNAKSQIGVLLNVRSRLGLRDNASSEARAKRICFPGKTAEEAWRFTVIIRILGLVRDAIIAGTTISKRDLYYRAPSLFRSQQVVDRHIDLIASTFRVPRSALSVTAAAKGLALGACSLRRSDGSELFFASEREGTLIPSLKNISCASLEHVRWILVIEKESSFRALASNAAFFARVCCQGLLITGKGYPDLNTRALLHFISTPFPRNGFAAPPVYALVDFDPDGLAIMHIYRHGSSALAHEGESVRVPGLEWMGLGSREVVMAASNGRIAGEDGLLLLTGRDRGKAKKLLGRCTEDEQKADLQRMLMLGVKAELQMLEILEGGMAGWVGRRLDELGH